MSVDWRRRLRGNPEKLSKVSDKLNNNHKKVIVLLDENDGIAKLEKDLVLSHYINKLVVHNLVNEDYNKDDNFCLKLTSRGEYFLKNYIDKELVTTESLQKHLKEKND